MATNIKLRVCTWNVGNAPPPNDLRLWLGTEISTYDIIAVGAQEANFKDAIQSAERQTLDGGNSTAGEVADDGDEDDSSCDDPDRSETFTFDNREPNSLVSDSESIAGPSATSSSGVTSLRKLGRALLAIRQPKNSQGEKSPTQMGNGGRDRDSRHSGLEMDMKQGNDVVAPKGQSVGNIESSNKRQFLDSEEIGDVTPSDSAIRSSSMLFELQLLSSNAVSDTTRFDKTVNDGVDRYAKLNSQLGSHGNCLSLQSAKTQKKLPEFVESSADPGDMDVPVIDGNEFLRSSSGEEWQPLPRTFNIRGSIVRVPSDLDEDEHVDGEGDDEFKGADDDREMLQIWADDRCEHGSLSAQSMPDDSSGDANNLVQGITDDRSGNRPHS
jgi:hypothetical protein